MDKKTKSILIGICAAFATVLIIILLFFALSDVGKKNKPNDISNANANTNDIVSNAVQSDGNMVVPFDEEDNSDDTSSANDVSSQEVSSKAPVSAAAHFGRSDINAITKGIDTFSDFVSAVNPVSYEWNTDNMGAASEVNVKLIASDGSYAIVGVPYGSSDYTVDGEKSGSGKDIADWTVYKSSKSKSSRAKEIVWLSNNMKFTLPRNIKIGSSYNSITEAYLRKDNPDKTYLLYEGPDILTDDAKLKAYKKDKAAYIGGKIYKTSTLLNSFYKENNNAYPFAKTSTNVIRYGFNSIEDTSETSGQWFIEYATKNSKVMGVYFHMTGADD